MTACPRCGEDIGLGQEFCLECGARIPGAHLRDPGRDPGKGWIRRALVGFAVATAGAAIAIAATTEASDGNELLTATGGFATTPGSGTGADGAGQGRGGIVEWPATQEGWTIAVATLPQAQGKKRATNRAREARRSGLETVGILDTSRYASLHPGYWLVFAGVYSSEAQATSSLPPARAFARTAVVRRIVP